MIDEKPKKLNAEIQKINDIIRKQLKLLADNKEEIPKNFIPEEYHGLVTEIDIPDGIVGIKREAFIRCIELKSVTISSSVTSIGSYAFDGCSKLKLKFENPDFKIMENYPWGLRKDQISAA